MIETARKLSILQTSSCVVSRSFLTPHWNARMVYVVVSHEHC